MSSSNTLTPLKKLQPGDTPAPGTKCKHFIREADFLQEDADFARHTLPYNRRLHDAHVMRLGGSTLVYQKGIPLGGGGFGDCYVGMHSDLGPVAIKRARVDAGDMAQSTAKVEAITPEEAARELMLSSRYGGAGAAFFGVSVRNPRKAAPKLYTVSPLLLGSATEFYTRHGAEVNPTHFSARLLADVGQALATLETHGIQHADVKPDNVMMGRRGEHACFTLIDFGLSFPTDDDGVVNVFFGAPEAVLWGNFANNSDVYSLGLTTLFMLLDRHPLGIQDSFADMDPEDQAPVYAAFEAARSAAANAPPELVAMWHELGSFLEPAALQLVRDMLHQDPALRPSAAQVVARAQAIVAQQDTDDWASVATEFGPTVREALGATQHVANILQKQGRLGSAMSRSAALFRASAHTPGNWLKVVLQTVGGGLAGFITGGPVGAAVGAGVALTEGLIEELCDGDEEKKEAIKVLQHRWNMRVIEFNRRGGDAKTLEELGQIFKGYSDELVSGGCAELSSAFNTRLVQVFHTHSLRISRDSQEAMQAEYDKKRQALQAILNLRIDDAQRVVVLAKQEGEQALETQKQEGAAKLAALAAQHEAARQALDKQMAAARQGAAQAQKDLDECVANAAEDWASHRAEMSRRQASELTRHTTQAQPGAGATLKTTARSTAGNKRLNKMMNALRPHVVSPTGQLQLPQQAHLRSELAAFAVTEQEVAAMCQAVALGQAQGDAWPALEARLRRSLLAAESSRSP